MFAQLSALDAGVCVCADVRCVSVFSVPQEAQQNSLLDMEMADYERLVKELNTKLSERDVFVEDLKTQIQTHTQKVDTLNQKIGMAARTHTHTHKQYAPLTCFLCG